MWSLLPSGSTTVMLRSPGRPSLGGSCARMPFRRNWSNHGIDVRHVQVDQAAFWAIARVLGQKERQSVAGHLCKDRKAGFEPVFPINLKTEAIDVELLAPKRSQSSKTLASRAVVDSDHRPSSDSFTQESATPLLRTLHHTAEPLLDYFYGRNSAPVHPSSRVGKRWLGDRHAEDVAIRGQQCRRRIPASNIRLRQRVLIDHLVAGREAEHLQRLIEVSAHYRGVHATASCQEHQSLRARLGGGSSSPYGGCCAATSDGVSIAS